MLVGGVVADEFGDDAHAAAVRLPHQLPEVVEPAVHVVDPPVVGDVITVVAKRRGVEGQQPDRRHPQLLEMVELLDQPREVADTVIVGVEEGANVKLVDDGVLVPLRVVVDGEGCRPLSHRHLRRSTRNRTRAAGGGGCGRHGPEKPAGRARCNDGSRTRCSARR